MVFSSHIFIFYFLPVVLAIYYAMLAARTSITARHLFLTCAGMVFYGWWNPWFVLLMLGTTALDYNLGRMIVNAEKLRERGGTDADVQRRKKLGVVLSVTSNLAVLAFFKYTAFAIDSVEGVASWMEWGHVEVPPFFRNIILPAGISFYVFQSLSYCVDLYRGHAKPAESFLDFTCFVSLFPHLVAGPIVRYGIIADQMRHRVHTVQGFALGMTRFSFGLAKKILLADPMGTIADSAFGAGEGSLTTFSAWIGIVAYAFQIYFDFSGYSDMAIGLAKTLGFYFVENFNSPYKSASITDFWRRWHMSLSAFLRDYLYIPLGGNRHGEARTYFALMATMLLGGLWHGASWTFVVWGGLHGLYLSLERVLRARFKGYKPGPLAMVGLGLLTYALINITWVFFRAKSFEQAWTVLQSMFGGNADAKPILTTAHLATVALIVGGIVAAHWLMRSRTLETMIARQTPLRLSAALGVMAFAVVAAQGTGNAFIYFQF